MFGSGSSLLSSTGLHDYAHRNPGYKIITKNLGVKQAVHIYSNRPSPQTRRIPPLHLPYPDHRIFASTWDRQQL